MENNNTNYIDLFTKYLSGEAASEETLLLSSWLKSDDNVKKQFEEFRTTWLLIEKNKINLLINVDAEWDKFKLNIKKSKDKKIYVIPLSKANTKSNPYYKYLRIAAIFIFFIVASVVIYKTINNNEIIKLYAKVDATESELPDGTTVTLNSGSMLEYFKKFNKNQREVMLNGEAYFDVKHDNSKPFIISTDNIRIEDLGTSFLVNTNTVNGNLEVVLTSGSVAIYYKDKSDNKIVLKLGEKAVVYKSQKKIIKSMNQDKNYMAWKTKKLIFIDDSLSKIVETLNEVYHSNIQIADKNLSICRITATFDNQTLESVLNVLKATVDIKTNNHGSTIEIIGKGCK